MSTEFNRLSINKYMTALIYVLAIFGLSSGFAQNDERIFELRTYTAQEGRLADVANRFQNYTNPIFAKHNMVSVGYWIPTDTPNTFVYILAHTSREIAAKNWKEFSADPEWQAAKAQSELNGPIVAKVVSIFMKPTNFSPIK